MKYNEIIKALECCQYEGVKTCRDCPMFYTHEFDNEIDFDCGKYIYGRALDLINRQKEKIAVLSVENANLKICVGGLNAELENKNVELVGMRGACESYKMHYDNAQAEVERLKTRNDKCYCRLHPCRWLDETAL